MKQARRFLFSIVFSCAFGLLWPEPLEVRTGVYLLNLYDLNMDEHSFYADFYVWFKWRGDSDPTNIEFVNMVEKWGQTQAEFADSIVTLRMARATKSCASRGGFSICFGWVCWTSTRSISKSKTLICRSNQWSICLTINRIQPMSATRCTSSGGTCAAAMPPIPYTITAPISATRRRRPAVQQPHVHTQHRPAVQLFSAENVAAFGGRHARQHRGLAVAPAIH